MRLPRDLGDGLVLRAGRPSDVGQLVELNGLLHTEPSEEPPDAFIAEWTRELFELDHPTFSLDELTVVEDVATGEVVSSMCTIPQVWSCGGATLPAGRPELVGTRADHRGRGLIRLQMDEAHDRGRAAGHLLQFITGIPGYYRRFGYDYALDLRPQPFWRPGDRAPDTGGPVALRPATAGDLAFLASVDRTWPAARGALGAVRDEAAFAHELARRPGALQACTLLVIERRGTADGPGRPIGYLAHHHEPWEAVLAVRAVELLPGHGWLEPAGAVLAHLHAEARRRGLVGVTFGLPAAHPLLRCLGARLGVSPGHPYGVYVRIPDLAALVAAIGPVLERRLAASPALGFTGELHVDFSGHGLRLRLEEGRVAAVEPWAPPGGESGGDAGMPRAAFCNLLLGNRSLGQLLESVADCEVRTEAGGLLLDVLFPPMPFQTWWLG